MPRFLGGTGRRLTTAAAALSLVTGAMPWSASQAPVSLAKASACNSHSEASCDTKAARAEDAKEARTEDQCRLEHTEKVCRDRARAEDRDEQKTECDEGGNDQNSDCEPYGAHRDPGENHVHIAELDAATRSLANAGLDLGVIGTTVSIVVVLGILLMVAFDRRRIGPPGRNLP
jgi:hypothetical protein